MCLKPLKNTTRAVDGKPVRQKKIKMRQVLVTWFHTRKFDISIRPFFHLYHLAAQCLEVWTVNNAKMNKDLPTGGRF